MRSGSRPARSVFFDVAYQSYLPSLVSRDELLEGNSKLTMSASTAQIGGPGLGGTLVAALGAPYAILADAASFVGSALLLLRIRRREPVPERAEAPSMRRELLEGLRYILGDARWRAMAANVAASNFCAAVAFSVFLLYAVRELELSPAVLGIVFGLGNFGALAGAAAAPRLGRRFGPGPLVLASAIMLGPPLLLVPLAPQSFPVPFFILAELLVGAAVVVYNISGISLQQALTPHGFLGRLSASRRFLVWGTIPLGAFVGGALGSIIGLRPTIFVGSIAACFTFLPLLFSPVPGIKELPSEPVPGPPEEGLRLPLETQAADA